MPKVIKGNKLTDITVPSTIKKKACKPKNLKLLELKVFYYLNLRII